MQHIFNLFDSEATYAFFQKEEINEFVYARHFVDAVSVTYYWLYARYHSVQIYIATVAATIHKVSHLASHGTTGTKNSEWREHSATKNHFRTKISDERLLKYVHNNMIT